jgi:predicted aspartyl protease
MSAIIRDETTMARVTTQATIENLRDLWEAESGQRTATDVRRVTVENALVDTGAFTLSLPTSIVAQLGLKKTSTRRVMTAAGPREANRYSTCRLTIQGRDAAVDVVEVPDGCPVLIGQIPLDYMDFVVDPANQRLIGNPEHGGDWVNDLY